MLSDRSSNEFLWFCFGLSVPLLWCSFVAACGGVIFGCVEGTFGLVELSRVLICFAVFLFCAAFGLVAGIVCTLSLYFLGCLCSRELVSVPSEVSLYQFTFRFLTVGNMI